MEAFVRDAGELAGERALPAEGPLDIERIATAAERSAAVKILGSRRSASPAPDLPGYGGRRARLSRLLLGRSSSACDGMWTQVPCAN